MGGAFQTSRRIFDSDIWSDIPKFRIFFYIYGNAVFAHEGIKMGSVLVKRGQLLKSYRNLQEELAYLDNRSIKKYSLSVIKRKIDSLINENRLKIEDTELGTLFTVVNYEQYQRLDNYSKSDLERRKNADGTQLERSENNNKNVKKVKNVKKDIKKNNVAANLKSVEEIKVFVDLKINDLPQGVSRKILISYFDCIRLTRRTCSVSSNILINLIDKMNKYSVDQLNYALWTHFEKHDDKKENYTLGILRGTDVHEAKRGLMKLKNKGVASFAKSSQYPTAVRETESSTSKETERLEAIARERGLHGTVRDVNVDF